jgi:hypothetical protein
VCCKRIAIWNQSKIGDFVTSALARTARKPGQPSVKAVTLVVLVRPTVSRVRWISAVMSVSALVTAPKIWRLSQIVLVVTCAPSLENSYTFEMVTQHRMRDFHEIDAVGIAAVKRWFKQNWSNPAGGIVGQISAKLEELVRGHLENVEKRLMK